MFYVFISQSYVTSSVSINVYGKVSCAALLFIFLTSRLVVSNIFHAMDRFENFTRAVDSPTQQPTTTVQDIDGHFPRKSIRCLIATVDCHWSQLRRSLLYDLLII